MQKLKIILFLLYIGFPFLSFTQGSFQIIGNIDSKYNDAVVSLSGNFENHYGITETKVSDGKFYISGKIDQKFKHVYLRIKKDKTFNSFDFFITNKKMFINLSKADYIEQLHMSSQNVPFESIQTKYENLIKPIKNSINSYYNLIHNSSKIIDKFIIDSLHKIYDLQKETLLKSQIEFIKQYSNSYFSFYIFYNSVVNKTYRLSVDSILSIYSQFSDNIKQTPDGKRVLDSINRMQKLQINELMPDFLFRNITNDSYHLFQFKKSNYVLLCFWASWCIPCVENIPRLKSIDSLYGDKGLQLISISVDANKDLWIKSLEKYKMPWLQTCDLPEYVSKLKLHSLYNINWVPQYFLIDKKGILIYQNLQSKDDDSYSVLEKKLKEIFQYNENVK